MPSPIKAVSGNYNAELRSKILVNLMKNTLMKTHQLGDNVFRPQGVRAESFEKMASVLPKRGYTNL